MFSGHHQSLPIQEYKFMTLARSALDNGTASYRIWGTDVRRLISAEMHFMSAVEHTLHDC